jgi:hypothetical protein
MLQCFAEVTNRDEALQNLLALGFDVGLIADSVPDDAVIALAKGVAKMRANKSDNRPVPTNGGSSPGVMALRESYQRAIVRTHFQRFAEAYGRRGISETELLEGFESAKRLYGADYSAREHGIEL